MASNRIKALHQSAGPLGGVIRMDKINERVFERQNYRSPLEIWSEFRDHWIRWKTEGTPREEFQKRMRRNKERWERWQAFAFAQGLSVAVRKQPVELTQFESSDFDIVCRIQTPSKIEYLPVQLKEVVPEDLNNQTDAQIVLNKLSEYCTSNDTAVSVYLTRPHSAGTPFRVPSNLQLESLWLVGLTEINPLRFVIIGDCLSCQEFYNFGVPK